MLIWCLIGETAAYVVALLSRYLVFEYLYPNKTREYEFYRIYYFFILLVYSVVFFVRRGKVRRPWEMDFWEKTAEVLKSQTLVLFFELFFLFFIGWGRRISRTVVGLLFVVGIILDIFIRREFSKHYIKKYGNGIKNRDICLIAAKEEIPRIKFCIERYGYKNDHKDIWNIHNVKTAVTPEDLCDIAPDLSEGYDLIFVSADAAAMLGSEGMEKVYSFGLPVCTGIKAGNRSLPEKILVEEGSFAAFFESRMSRKYPVLGVEYTSAGCSEAAAYVLDHVKELKGSYICFSNVHTTVMAADDAGYRDVLNGSAFTFPDGLPIAARIYEGGFPEAERVAGPDFMEEAFRLSMESGEKHFFYGSTEKTLECLKAEIEKRFPWMNVAGMYSPPFRDLTPEEDAEVIKMINESGADLVWIGLGAPKQEKWMAAHKDKIDALMLGVGAGFDFHAGTVDRAPKLLQGIGLEWLYRLFQNPKRLFKRYLVTNTKFMLYTRFKRK